VVFSTVVEAADDNNSVVDGVVDDEVPKFAEGAVTCCIDGKCTEAKSSDDCYEWLRPLLTNRRAQRAALIEQQREREQASGPRGMCGLAVRVDREAENASWVAVERCSDLRGEGEGLMYSCEVRELVSCSPLTASDTVMTVDWPAFAALGLGEALGLQEPTETVPFVVQVVDGRVVTAESVEASCR
jgi:hypothetical protein